MRVTCRNSTFNQVGTTAVGQQVQLAGFDNIDFRLNKTTEPSSLLAALTGAVGLFGFVIRRRK